ncbi:RNA polymerase subunit sigma-24 [Oceanibaculum pacificum]|uniref:RNA polymerase subunit sigma-24 n=1 Tax=Oceanibaculum pacificum TaxID=580166 RepID=A0A154VS71_9PROT|nr:RNA polymerase subunit sigma-24 [Oceanibaculum pacificum]
MNHEPTIVELFSAHRGELVNYASRILGDRSHAEDVVQEAYLRLDSAIVDQPLREPLAYLYRIVRNLSLDVRRRLMRERGRMPSGGEAAMDEIAEDRPSPESEVGARGEVRLLAQAMAELPDRTRVALEMHRFAGCSIREIANRLDISVGTAHALVIDGMEHCRRRLFRGR